MPPYTEKWRYQWGSFLEKGPGKSLSLSTLNRNDIQIYTVKCVTITKQWLIIGDFLSSAQLLWLISSIEQRWEAESWCHLFVASKLKYKSASGPNIWTYLNLHFIFENTSMHQCRVIERKQIVQITTCHWLWHLPILLTNMQQWDISSVCIIYGIWVGRLHLQAFDGIAIAPISLLRAY